MIQKSFLMKNKFWCNIIRRKDTKFYKNNQDRKADRAGLSPLTISASAGQHLQAKCATHSSNELHIKPKACRPERNEVESNGSHQITWAAFQFCIHYCNSLKIILCSLCLVTHLRLWDSSTSLGMTRGGKKSDRKTEGNWQVGFCPQKKNSTNLCCFLCNFCFV